MTQSHDRPFLLDVSRLIWRIWRGKLPTGIDRVCLAYCEHFGSRSMAVVQWKALRFVLPPTKSDALFALIKSSGPGFRMKVAMLIAWPAAKRQIVGKFYLNVGHTGLDAPGLPHWLKRWKMKPIFLIHDLIPITHPQFCRRGEDDRHILRTRQALISAHGILVNSGATHDALSHSAATQNLPMPPTRVAWLGTDKTGEAAPVAPPARPYFVMTGTIEARKNHHLLLQVWSRLITTLGENCPDLILIGQRGWEAEAVFALLDNERGFKGHVHEMGRCDDAMRLALLDGARALLMPSFIEGFGLPVIEALQRGVPVIASDLPVFREFAGDIPLYLDPHDLQGWEIAIRDFTGPCPDRTRQLAQAARYTAPDWPTHFRRVETWLRTLA